MELAFILAGEITQVKESIPWVRCASGNVFVIWGKLFGEPVILQNRAFLGVSEYSLQVPLILDRL